MPGGPFPVGGIAWTPDGYGVLDGAGPRLLWVRSGSLDAHDEVALPSDPDGIPWQGLAYDGTAFWSALDARAFRLTSFASPTEVFDAEEMIADVEWHPDERWLLTSETTRICAYRADGVCQACWRSPELRTAPGGIAWDGDELWMVDPELSRVLRTRPAGLGDEG